MPDAVVFIIAVVAMLVAAGFALGLANRGGFSPRWLFVAAGLAVINDALLTNFYGALPDLFGASDWNWQGKLLALAATLAIASHPAFGWRRSGLTLKQNAGSLRAAVPVAVLYCLFFLALALSFPNEPASGETLAFQLTLPEIGRAHV